MLRNVTDWDLKKDYPAIYRGEVDQHFLLQDPETHIVFHLKNPLLYDILCRYAPIISQSSKRLKSMFESAKVV